MNFLLYSEAGDEDNDLALEHMEDTLACDTIGLPHRLDIVKMATSETGHFVTVALDRTIAITVADATRQTYRTIAVPDHVLQLISWPIRHLAVDDGGEWTACHCSDDKILVYNSVHGSVIPNVVPYPDDHGAQLFTFVSLPSGDGTKLHLLVLTSAARIAMTCLDSGLSHGNDLAHLPLMGATIEDTSQGRQLYTVGMEANITAHAWTGAKWATTKSAQLQIETEEGHLGAHLTTQVGIQSYRDLNTELLVVTTSASAIFLDNSTLAHVAKFDINAGGPSVDQLLIGTSRLCPACGSLAIRRAAIATEKLGDADASIMTTWFVNSNDDDSNACICLARRSAACKAFNSAQHETYTISPSGAWSTTAKGQAVIGLRKPPRQVANGAERPTTSHLRHRKRERADLDNSHDDVWEAYKLSIDGDLQVLELPPPETDSLYVSNAGPALPLDSQSIVVAFGNSVKIIRSSRRATITGSRRSTLTTSAALLDNGSAKRNSISGRKTI